MLTVGFADTIAVLHGGEVIEQGQHRDLLRRKGVYAKLVQHQLSGQGGFVV
jgi:ABC-type multidrug transport system fused ATPase/permease subunit